MLMQQRVRAVTERLKRLKQTAGELQRCDDETRQVFHSVDYASMAVGALTDGVVKKGKLKMPFSPMELEATGRFDFEAFLSTMVQFENANDEDSTPFDKLTEAFQTFEVVEGSSLMSEAEICHVLTTLGEPMELDDVKDMIREAGVVDDQGHVSFQALVEKLVSRTLILDDDEDDDSTHNFMLDLQRMSDN